MEKMKHAHQKLPQPGKSSLPTQTKVARKRYHEFIRDI
jgi:hypothetical protein